MKKKTKPKGDIPLHYPGRRLGLQTGCRPVVIWNLAYYALPSSLAGLADL